MADRIRLEESPFGVRSALSRIPVVADIARRTPFAPLFTQPPDTLNFDPSPLTEDERSRISGLSREQALLQLTTDPKALRQLMTIPPEQFNRLAESLGIPEKPGKPTLREVGGELVEVTGPPGGAEARSVFRAPQTPPERTPGDVFIFTDQSGKEVDRVFGDDDRLPGLLRNTNLKLTRLQGQSTSINADVRVLQPGTAADVEQRVVNNVEALSRLQAIEREFDPAFFQIGPRAGKALDRFLERAGLPIGADAKERIASFTTQAQNINTNLNQTIRDLTGAAMSIPEAERIGKTEISEKDSETEARTKLRNKMQATRLSIARSILLLQRGIRDRDPWDVMSLLDMKEFIQAEALDRFQKRIETSGDTPNSRKQAAREVTQEMMRDFGIDPFELGETPDSAF